MPLRPPTKATFDDLGDELFLDLTDEELEYFVELANEKRDAYETVMHYEPTPRLGGAERRERSGGTRVPPAENPHNAWVNACYVGGDEDGALDGWEVGIKDNVSVAGVEMTCGSQVVAGYVPNRDATIVTRLLEAGADIVGKTNMDDMAMTSTGHSAFGPITNPHDEAYLAGGSSGGSAVAVARGEVDAAIGSDQGGSVRVPAAFCGIVGHKPTYGLVPYTGCIGIEHAIDHPGPMAADVETVARMLTVIAGSNERDLRSHAPVPTEQYEDALDGDISDLTIGVLEEGFDIDGANEAVLETVRDSIDDLEAAGATTEAVSVPMHSDAKDIHDVCTSEGLLDAMLGEGLGHGWKAWYNRSWIESFGKARRAQSNDLPARLKLLLLMGAYTNSEYHSRYYAQAMNLVVELTEQYDSVLEDVDLLAMPTAVTKPPKHDPDRDQYDRLQETNLIHNATPFNRTGHPGVSVPAGPVDGLPTGLMLVGQRFDDATVLNAASVLESESEMD
ncbi:putative amidase [Natrialba magadii ATCC 43099]|uniref:Amidase n=1 Tax=Natrialba magadii (strain ATCC 43099 / DSM 3394 / CCM 3739 / CIP 104546 / IAM 13178 / JCM 8861 / NBRC 102185 / NCIMB 2190 / MS3) TaxID=547559 RepID=D3SZY6_NATMM|nr:amidase [Natrialba magadii]ADD06396.1 putative amidase [Natrialba magadii ATCC 43099]ELY31577.1 amidase [Natrialba magadii ATCC 43099]